MITPDMEIKTTIEMEITDEDGTVKKLRGEIGKNTLYNEETGQFIVDFEEVE